MPRITKKQIEAFRSSALEILRAYGFRESVPGVELRDYVVETIAGPLLINIYEDWLACAFDNVAEARKVYPPMHHSDRLNPHSGKWNWMNGSLDLPDFERELKKLVVNPVPNPELRAVPLEI